MTIQDIHRTFKVVLDKNAESISFGGCPAFLEEEIDIFLNQAMLEVIFNKFTGYNPQNVSFEGTIKRLTDLQTLVMTDNGLTMSLDSVNGSGNSFLLNSTFSGVESEDDEPQRLLYVDATTHDGNDDSLPMQCRLISHADTARFKWTYNNYPWIQDPVITLQDDRIRMYVSPEIAMNGSGNMYLNLTYVKYPLKFDYTNDREYTEVPDYIYTEVINRAAVIALENTESARTGSKLEINTLQE